MYGRRPEYMPWGKMPFRDPSERLAKVGKGFSHMLSSINLDSQGGLTRYESSRVLPPVKDNNLIGNTETTPREMKRAS